MTRKTINFSNKQMKDIKVTIYNTYDGNLLGAS